MTGVQTCALPISGDDVYLPPPPLLLDPKKEGASIPLLCPVGGIVLDGVAQPVIHRFIEYKDKEMHALGTKCFQEGINGYSKFGAIKSSCLIAFQPRSVAKQNSYALLGGGVSDKDSRLFYSLAKKVTSSICHRTENCFANFSKSVFKIFTCLRKL